MGNPGGKCIAVRTGECRIGVRPRVAFHSPVDRADQLVNTITAKFLEEAWPFPVPVAVGQILLNTYYRKTTALASTDNFIHRTGTIDKSRCLSFDSHHTWLRNSNARQSTPAFSGLIPFSFR